MINCKISDKQKKRRPIIIEKYNPQWALFFEKESRKIKSVLGENAVEIHHIGSTSVPLLSSKPIIDMILVTKDLKVAREFLTSKALGYRYKGEYNLLLRDLYGKKDEFEIYLHVHLVNSPEIDLNLRFRNYLRYDEVDRNEYEAIKIAASKNPNSTDKTETGITKYNLLKNNFITSVLRKSRFLGVCARFVTQDTESEFFDKVKNSYGKNCICENSFCEQNKKKIVLYKGIDMVGTAELLLIDLDKLLINFVWIKSNSKELLRKLLCIIEDWCKIRIQATLLQANVENDQAQTYFELGFIPTMESMFFVKKLRY